MPAVAQPYQETLDVYRRRLIVDAARRVFETSGLEGASIRAIAQMAGCTTGAIYPLFRSKEEIFAVVLGESLSTVTEEVRAAMDGIVAPAKSLRRGTLAIYKYYDAHPSELALSLVLFNEDRKKRLGSGLDEILKRQLDGLLALLAEQVRKATAKPFLPMVRIEPSSASPSSPRNGPLEPARVSDGPCVGAAPLSESQSTMVLSSTPAALTASSTWPVR